MVAVRQLHGKMTNTLTHLMSPFYPKDDQITTLCVPWTTPLVSVERNLYAHAQNGLHMLMVPKAEAENSNILKLQ